MRWNVWAWVQRVRGTRGRDIDEEMAYDLAAEAEEHIRSGLSREEAERASRRDFGNLLLLQEEVRDIRSWTFLERLVQDVRYGLRTMRRNPLFTAMAVLSLALSIGANTAIFSVMNAIMMRALPVRNPGELAILNWRAKGRPAVVERQNGSSYNEPGGDSSSPDFPWPAYELFRDHTTVFSTLFAYKDTGRLNLSVRGQAELGQVELVSGNFFSGLGLVPAAGRLLGPGDDRQGAPHVAMISYQYGRDRFGGEAAAIGQTVRIKNLPFTIVGVAPPEFFGVASGSAPLVYVPMAARPILARNFGDEQKTMFVDPRFYWVDIMGRLRPGVTLAGAEAELAPAFHRLVLAAAANDRERGNLPSLWVEEGGSGIDALRRQFSKPLFVLMIMVVAILAIACANIASLLLARGNARGREIAVRLSLGASRPRIIRQLLTESVLLAMAGTVLGTGVAVAGTRFLISLLAGGREDFTLHAGLDWHVLAFTIAAALATGIVFGLAPALQATRVDITPGIKGVRASTPRRRGRRIGLVQALVVGQIALSLLLVLGAALFVRTLANLHSVELGFNPENLLTFNLDAGQAGYSGSALTAFYGTMTERFRGLAGVQSATLSDIPFVANANTGFGVILPGVPKVENRDRPRASTASVGPAFFETMQLPLLLGRGIEMRDTDGAPLVAVVNETFAKKFFPNQNPIGRHFGLAISEAGDLTIVGVAKDARYDSLKRAIPPVAYISYLQNVIKRPSVGMFFELRTDGNPAALIETVRKVVREAAPSVPVSSVMTQAQRIDTTIAQERAFAGLCTAFAALALAIACVGLYGSMAYAVSRRTNEIGIRMALGAARRRILWMVLREVLALSAAGLGIGLAAASGALPAIQSFVFGVKPADPWMIALAGVILLAALLVAGFAPAARASRVDPLTALRHE